jgi:hypothetical protein
MTMDPKTQECLGHYLYGAGFFARDQNTLGMVIGEKNPSHFCLSCPQKEECENRHEVIVREEMPAAAEKFDEIMAGARARGADLLATAFLASTKGLDPYAASAAMNFELGHRDRGMRDGLLAGERKKR